LSDNRNKNTDKNAEHILVCISSSPSNTKIIQTASSMAKAFGAMFSALYIKTPSAASLEPKDKERLLSNIHFAEECGASVTTVCGDDIPFQIAEYARLSGVTKIVIGRSVVNKKRLALQPTLTEKLISLAPNVDNCIGQCANIGLIVGKDLVGVQIPNLNIFVAHFRIIIGHFGCAIIWLKPIISVTICTNKISGSPCSKEMPLSCFDYPIIFSFAIHLIMLIS